MPKINRKSTKEGFSRSDELLREFCLHPQGGYRLAAKGPEQGGWEVRLYSPLDHIYQIHLVRPKFPTQRKSSRTIDGAIRSVRHFEQLVQLTREGHLS
jgi:hypothetical protein